MGYFLYKRWHSILQMCVQFQIIKAVKKSIFTVIVHQVQYDTAQKSQNDNYSHKLARHKLR